MKKFSIDKTDNHIIRDDSLQIFKNKIFILIEFILLFLTYHWHCNFGSSKCIVGKKGQLLVFEDILGLNEENLFLIILKTELKLGVFKELKNAITSEYLIRFNNRMI